MNENQKVLRIKKYRDVEIGNSVEKDQSIVDHRSSEFLHVFHSILQCETARRVEEARYSSTKR